MCSDPEHIKSSSSSQTMENNNNNCSLNDEIIDPFANTLLELAADNNLDEFKQSLDQNPSAINAIGLWYGRKKGCNQMVLQNRTPLMVAATYGSLDVLKIILSTSEIDVNKSCGDDKTTALHCAASSGSLNAVDVVKLLLTAGADSNIRDVNGFRPADSIVVSPKLVDIKTNLDKLLGKTYANGSSNSTDLLPSMKSLPMISTSSSSAPEKKEYPIDPSLPDIKNSIYMSDEFRMFSFKVRPCSRAYSHDWTECPFVHPGENARRRDPRKYHYSCVPCPDFRKGACRRGDLCEYAHGVFESWLHPAQYRTRLCKDGTDCDRRVCFFAHTNEELRPLYMSTGSAVPSPRSSMEMAAAMGLMSGSPSSFTPPMSPVAANGLSHSGIGWPQPNVPALHLPGSNLQSSRLRSSLSARDMPVDDYSMMKEFESQQLINDLCMSRLRSMNLTPSNLDDLFSSEISSSPRLTSEQGAVFSSSHKGAVFNQFLSPIKTNVPGHNGLLQASIGISSPGRMSPRNMEPISPINSRFAAIAQREKKQNSLRSLSSRDLGSNASSLSPSWSKWASGPNTLDWGVGGEDLGQLKRSSSFEMKPGGEEPDLSWVQSLVKETPSEKVASANSNGGFSTANNELEDSDNDLAVALGAYLEKMKLNQMAA